MSEIRDGGPAFPVEHLRDGMPWVNPGMSLRDWFAGQAVRGEAGNAFSHQHLAKRAYEIADAMLAARTPTS